MVLSGNDNSSNYLFSFDIAQHFPSITDNITSQPACVTIKGMLNATLAHYRCTYMLTASLTSLSPTCALYSLYIFYILG